MPLFILLSELALGYLCFTRSSFNGGATHAHINVVGWLSTGLIGVIYSVYPKAGNSQLGKLQFWLHQIGLPFLLIGMMMIYLDVPLIVLEIFVSGGGVAFLISVVLFIINLFQNVHASESK